MSCSASATRTASSYPIGSNGTTRRMLSSWTTTSLAIESTSERPAWVSTSVTSASQREESPGVSSGTGTISSRRFLIAATRRIIVTYCSTSGPPMSKTRPTAWSSSSTPTR